MANTFRSAFNGFNREDVVHYLEFLNNKHSAQINQMAAETDELRKQLAAIPEPNTEELDELREQYGELEQRLAETNAQNDELQAKCAALESKCADLIAKVDEAKAALTQAQSTPAPSVMSSHVDQELEAYRRAERAERVARERAEVIYRQTNSVLADANAKVEGATDCIDSIMEQLISQMELLKNAVGGSKQALQEASATIYSIRPVDEQD